MFALLLLFCTCCYGGKLMDLRYGFNECSLTTASGGCALDSTQGTDATTGALRMFFGEQNCSVKITKCKHNICYLMADITTRIQTDETDHALPSSFFTMVSMSGANFRWTKKGIEFEPTSGTVWLNYTTTTCGGFYSYRGYSETQSCGDYIPAVTTPTAGLPLACSTG